MDGTGGEMPRYRCHKVVHALQILEIEGLMITPAEEGYAPFELPIEYFRRHEPSPGGYYVVYKDGYASFSPRRAFEEGYKRIFDAEANVPTLGRMVRYVLTGDDAEKINRRRTSGASILTRMERGVWPVGAQAHIGAEVHAGDYWPGLIVAVARGSSNVNLQVFLDGCDVFWAVGRNLDEAHTPGTWHWPL